jgi:hypothetical protein
MNVNISACNKEMSVANPAIAMKIEATTVTNVERFGAGVELAWSGNMGNENAL